MVRGEQTVKLFLSLQMNLALHYYLIAHMLIMIYTK